MNCPEHYVISWTYFKLIHHQHADVSRKYIPWREVFNLLRYEIAIGPGPGRYWYINHDAHLWLKWCNFRYRLKERRQRHNAEPVVCYGGDGSGHEAYWREDRTCSFCGSLHPDDFLQAMRDTVDPASSTYIDPTTKFYKFYVIDGASCRKFYDWHMALHDKAWAEEAHMLMPHVKRYSHSKMDRFTSLVVKRMMGDDASID